MADDLKPLGRCCTEIATGFAAARWAHRGMDSPEELRGLCASVARGSVKTPSNWPRDQGLPGRAAAAQPALFLVAALQALVSGKWFWDAARGFAPADSRRSSRRSGATRAGALLRARFSTTWRCASCGGWRRCWASHHGCAQALPAHHRPEDTLTGAAAVARAMAVGSNLRVPRALGGPPEPRLRCALVGPRSTGPQRMPDAAPRAAGVT